MKTRRQEIIELIEDNPMTAKDISQSLGMEERQVIEHLEHIRQSVKKQGKKLVITPPKCLSCGFVFSKRDKLTPPGRCPECRSSHIQDPEFAIK